ncbi:hypothetical protein V7S43_006069 [Phytophthora oleae]|uniref:Crinkler effector protein N-terminal domain-containing protein n=1 Tax=Phytophthora oleae TaxID=2107226 RepID=A0ABD3FPB5_9STRA
MVTLFCSDGGSVFPVDIDENKWVGHLKIVIADALRYAERPDGLQLFVARKDKGRGAWLTQRDVAQGLSDTSDYKPLQVSNVELRYVGLASEDLGAVSIAEKLEGKGHVHVVVVLPQMQMRIGVNHRYAETIYSYMEIADRLKDSEEVRSLSERLMNLKEQGPPTPFVVLENSSGTGKTQMAFNLEARGECEVFYIVCGMLGDHEQSVYKAYAERTVTFRTCVERDLKTMRGATPCSNQDSLSAVGEICGNTTLALYSFILAALRGSDLCLGNVQRSQVQYELNRRAEIGAKPFVFFLDEFPRVRRTNTHIGDME